jgi:chemotaxis protein MotB
MAREPKPKESDETPGAPEWMVTFSDCMTLLLTFFVLLLSFSSFDDRVFRSLKVVYSKALTNITVTRRTDRPAVVDMPPIRHIVELDKGSEKQTKSRGEQENLMKRIESVNPRQGIAFVIPSDRLFWGKGTALSSQGSRTMDLLGSLLEKVPSRLVISETGNGADRTSVHFGLPRAWAILDYLSTSGGVNRERLSISQSSSLPRGSSPTGSNGSRNERKVEIVLLERGIYD